MGNETLETLSPYNGNSTLWGTIGNGTLGNITPSLPVGVRPSLFLNSNLSLGGSGTQSNPFTIQ